jgi:hypothetical protein
MQELFNYEKKFYDDINPLNAKLNPICHLLALLGAHLIFHVSRVRVNFVGYMWQETAADHSRKVRCSYHSNNFQKNCMFAM